MSERIQAREMGPHEYAVTVTEGTLTTNHRVTVPEDLRADLGVAGADEQQLVTESFAFLLEKEPSTAIYEEFPLDVILDRFPDFADEIRARLAGATMVRG
jgi:bifunctional DNA-binding transcriptional regulator/antitoxin component of YhaV-PrlF toxin-antitoxin module